MSKGNDSDVLWQRGKIFSFIIWVQARTTDARWGNHLHCMAENFYVWPKHFLFATLAQIFRFLWFVPSIGAVSIVRGGKDSICITYAFKAFEFFWFFFLSVTKRGKAKWLLWVILVESMQLHNLCHIFCYCTIYKEIALNWTQNTMLTSFFFKLA